MSFTYGGDPNNSPLESVRFLVEDTNPNDPQLNDAEVTFLLNQHVNIYKAAGYAARNIASKYARQVSKAVGDLRLEYQQRQAAYTDMQKDLLRQSMTRTSLPVLTGASYAEALTDDQNPDLRKAVFTKHQFHYPDGQNNSDANQSIIGPADQTD